MNIDLLLFLTLFNTSTPLKSKLNISSSLKTHSQNDDDEEDDSESVDLPNIKSNAFARPKHSDVLSDDIEIPKPGTPEYDAILDKVLPKKSPPPREDIFPVVIVVELLNVSMAEFETVLVGSRQYIVIPGRWIYT
ncbi:50S ribosomal protein L21 chloroplastic [Bienertia sinuspersici]